MNTALGIIKAQLNTISPEEQYKILYELTYDVCNSNNWGDPFSYARWNLRDFRKSVLAV